MDSSLDNLQWPHIQSFAAVAKNGSLSAAARSIESSQPTISRHISILEGILGITLFKRTGNGLELTKTGLYLLAHAEEMAMAANRFALAASGRSESLAGTIRITASISVAGFLLPPILSKLHIAEPEIEIELVASDQSDNLLLREADIAVRMFRPTQQDLITRKVGQVRIGAFASHDYIARRSEPEKFEDIYQHTVIGTERTDQTLEGLRAVGLDADKRLFSLRCENQMVAWELVLSGFGVGFNHLSIGNAEPLVKRLLPSTQPFKLPIWLTSHRELKTNRRVRRVFDFLADELSNSD